MSRRSTFFVRRQARLAARLQLIVYCWRFARRVGGRVVVLWPPMDAYFRQFDGAEYWPSKIFDLETFYGEGGGDSLVFVEGRFATPRTTRSVQDPEFAAQRPNRFDPAYFVREAPVLHEFVPITHTFVDEPATLDHFRASLRETYALLPHHPAVARNLALSKAAVGGGFVAVHVRRGDVVASLKRELPTAHAGLSQDRLASLLRAYAGRTAPFAAYDAAIEAALAEGARVVLFSDSPDSFAYFDKRHGSGRLVDAARLPSPPHLMQKAFVDFNLMVAADRIVGAGGSIYSTFASTLGAARMTNVAGAASLEAMRDDLFGVHLDGAPLGGEAKRAIEEELERQFAQVVRSGPDQAPPPPLK